MDMEITFPGGKKVNAEFRGFTFKTDQPESAGGENSAPSPFELFLASIGTCAGFYVVNFFLQRNLSTDGLRLVQRIERDSETHALTKLAIEIILPAGFPEKYKDAVIRTAEHCAVKNAIANPPAFDIYTTMS